MLVYSKLELILIAFFLLLGSSPRWNRVYNEKEPQLYKGLFDVVVVLLLLLSGCRGLLQVGIKEVERVKGSNGESGVR